MNYTQNIHKAIELTKYFHQNPLAGLQAAVVNYELMSNENTAIATILADSTVSRGTITRAFDSTIVAYYDGTHRRIGENFRDYLKRQTTSADTFGIIVSQYIVELMSARVVYDDMRRGLIEETHALIYELKNRGLDVYRMYFRLVNCLEDVLQMPGYCSECGGSGVVTVGEFDNIEDKTCVCRV